MELKLELDWDWRSIQLVARVQVAVVERWKKGLQTARPIQAEAIRHR
jgi:hypothetical protein